MELRRCIKVLKASLVGASVASTVWACGEARTTFKTVDAGDDGGSIPDDNDAGTDGGDQEGNDAGTDGGDEEEPDGSPGCEAPTCAGECLPYNPLEGDGLPVLLWLGPGSEEPPPCPDAAPAAYYTGHRDLLVPPGTCAPCTCGPSTGSCVLPTAIAAQASACNLNKGAPVTPTDAPAGWDGSCTMANPIPGGLSCGAYGLCTQSVGFAPLIEVESSCAPEATTQAPNLPDPQWGLVGRACGYDQAGCGASHLCAPSTVPAGYLSCLAWPGEHQCDAAAGFPEQIVLYDGFEDTRACSSCSCGPPQGALCSSLITLFQDSECKKVVGSGGAWSSGPGCVDVIPPGLPIGSKAASTPLYHPGTCEAAGGKLEGAVVPTGPTTLCCAP